MAQDLTVILEDRPGTLAEAGEALGREGINIDGACGFPSEGRGVLHLLVEDDQAAKAAIEGTGAEVSAVRDVLIVDVEDQPGSLGAVARKIGDAGVNIDLLYVASNNRLVIGADDLEKARAAL